jgi:hypothetical protein
MRWQCHAVSGLCKQIRSSRKMEQSLPSCLCVRVELSPQKALASRITRAWRFGQAATHGLDQSKLSRSFASTHPRTQSTRYTHEMVGGSARLARCALADGKRSRTKKEGASDRDRFIHSSRPSSTSHLIRSSLLFIDGRPLQATTPQHTHSITPHTRPHNNQTQETTAASRKGASSSSCHNVLRR